MRVVKKAFFLLESANAGAGEGAADAVAGNGLKQRNERRGLLNATSNCSTLIFVYYKEVAWKSRAH